MHLGDIPPLDVDLSNSTAPSPWADAIKSAAQAWGGVQQARTFQQLQQINIDRARAGLPPINTSQYQSGIPIQLDAQTQGTLSVLVIGALILGALMILRR